MITKHLLGYGQGLAERFGLYKVLGFCVLGCLLPIGCGGLFCCGLFLLLIEWR